MADTRQVSIAQKLLGRVARADEVRAKPGADALDAMAAPAAEDKVLRSLLAGQHLARIRVDLISPAPEGQARQDFDQERLQALADSLKRSGVREPIIVTPHGAAPGRFQIVAGERRWRAAQLAGLVEIPCLIDPNLVERKDRLLAQAEENLQRADLNPVEEATILAQLMEARRIDVREAGGLIGKSDIQARRLRRIHMAVAPIKQAIARGQLDARAAVEVIRIYNKLAREDASESKSAALKRIEELIGRVVREEWSIRKLERHAVKITGSADDDREASDTVAAQTSKPPEQDAKGQKPLGQQVGGSHQGPSHPEVPKSTALFTYGNGRLFVDTARIQRGEASPEQREQLIGVLEDVLMQVRRA